MPGIDCPHCKTRAIARSSSALSPLYREIHFRCENDACGHTFVAGLEILRTVSPSRTPAPGVHLPFSSSRRGAPRPANDDAPIVLPPAANDEAVKETG